MNKQLKRVVIDAGHGGKDPGALGSFTKEKDVTLAIALKVGKILAKTHPEVEVIYTRDTDTFIELYQRAKIANKAKADLFLSIHANSNKSKTPSGVEFYVLGLHKSEDNLDVAKMENSVVNLESNVAENYGFDPNSPEGNIIMTMKQSLFLDKSIQFAKNIENSYEEQENSDTSIQVVRGTRQAGFVVLYKTAMPSVLAEIGFISNPREETYIGSEEGQNEIAKKIAEGFADYKVKFETSAAKTGANKITTTETENIPKNAPEKMKTTSNTPEMPKSVSPEKLKALVPEKPKTAVKSSAQAATLPPAEIADNSSEKKTIIILDDFDERTKEAQKDQLARNPKMIITDKAPDKTLKIVDEEETLAVSNEAKNAPAQILNQPPKVIEKETITEKIVEKMPKKTTEIVEKRTLTIEDGTPSETAMAKKEAILNEKLSVQNLKNDWKPVAANAPKPNASIDEVKRNAAINEQKVAIQKEIRQETPPAKNAVVVSTPAPKTPVPNAPEHEVKRNIEASNSSAIANSAQITYYVQLLASPNSISTTDARFMRLKGVKESHEDGLYKYLYGECTSLETANREKQTVKDSGIKDAFVVKYQNGKRIK